MIQAEAFEACLPVIRALDDLGVDYLIGGSLASSFHGTPVPKPSARSKSSKAWTSN